MRVATKSLWRAYAVVFSYTMVNYSFTVTPVTLLSQGTYLSEGGIYGFNCSVYCGYYLKATTTKPTAINQ